jgi:acid phosphatase (class A)
MACRDLSVRLFKPLFLACALSLTIPVHSAVIAQDSPASEATPATSIIGLLPPPPVGLAEYRQDIKTLLAVQAKRTEAMCEFANADAEISLKRFLAPLDMNLQGGMAETEVLLEMLSEPMSDAIGDVKEAHKRPRPYGVDRRVVPCLPKAAPENFGFPSGHASLGYLYAAILTQMAPERQRDWYGRAESYAQSRLIGGVHYPSDVDAGRMLGLIMAERLLRRPEIRAQLEKARPELRLAVGL